MITIKLICIIICIICAVYCVWIMGYSYGHSAATKEILKMFEEMEQEDPE